MFTPMELSCSASQALAENKARGNWIMNCGMLLSEWDEHSQQTFSARCQIMRVKRYSPV